MSFKTLMKLMMMGYGMSDSLQKSLIPVPIEIKARPCLWCKTEHKHKNSFCSTDCCRRYQFMQKELRKNNRLHLEHQRIKKHINSPCFDGTSPVRSSI